jgi:branched-chain amino acid transport system ATP-binding protein
MNAVLLRVSGLRARYGPLEVLHEVDLCVRHGEAVALLGPNGAGKTTLLRAVSRMVPTGGRIVFAGNDLSALSTSAAARLGLGHVPAGRGAFADLTVLENLRLGLLSAPRPGLLSAPRRRRRVERARQRSMDLEDTLAMFPALADRLQVRAGLLSGGEQRMLALARALLGRPRLLLIDEPSQGLAPRVTAAMLATLAEVQRQRGLAILLAEQNARLSLELCDRAVILVGGRVVLESPTSAVTLPRLHAAYLGAGGTVTR